MTPQQVEALAQGVEAMREALGAMVAGLMSDGWTEEQSRDIVVALMKASDREAE